MHWSVCRTCEAFDQSSCCTILALACTASTSVHLNTVEQDTITIVQASKI